MSEPEKNLQQRLTELVPINGLVPQHQSELLRQGQFVSVRKGKFLFRQGDRDNWSYYLIAGVLELVASDELVKSVDANSDSARHALAQLQPRQMSARAKVECRVFRIDKGLMERYLTLEGTSDGSAMEVAEVESEDEGDWMAQMLQSDLFARIPPANIQQIFTHMESVSVAAGDVVVRQGTPGDYYYFIQQGHCEVTRKASANAPDMRLAKLHAGQGFGEESLVSDAPRNASITMLTEGRLMRLSKQNFIDLIKKPALDEIDFVAAEQLVADGAVWLDVRFPDEHKQSGLEGSINVPLNVLRMQAGKLDSDTRYIAYCDTGRRSSAGAFLLTQAGINATYLVGGLAASPVAQKLQGTVDAADKHPPAAAGPPAPAPADTPAAVSTGHDHRVLRERVSKLETQLAAAQGMLRRAAAFKQGAEAKFRETRAAFEERLRLAREAHERDLATGREAVAAARRLNAENQRLKKAMQVSRQTPGDAADQHKLKEALEERLLNLEAELEADRARHREEVERLQRMRDEAENRLQEERKSVEQESDDVAQQLQAAIELQTQAEDERRRVQDEMVRAVASEREKAESGLLDREREIEQRLAVQWQEKLQATELRIGELEDALRKTENEASDAQRSQQERIEELTIALESERAREAAAEHDHDSLRAELLADFEQRVAALRTQWDDERESLREQTATLTEELRTSQRKLQQEQTARSGDAQEARRQMSEAQRLRDEAEQAREALMQERQKREDRADNMRQMAVEEAERMIREYDASVAKLREEDDARVREERARLNDEISRLKQQLAAARGEEFNAQQGPVAGGL